MGEAGAKLRKRASWNEDDARVSPGRCSSPRQPHTLPCSARSTGRINIGVTFQVRSPGVDPWLYSGLFPLLGLDLLC